MQLEALTQHRIQVLAGMHMFMQLHELAQRMHLHGLQIWASFFGCFKGQRGNDNLRDPLKDAAM